MMLKYTIYLLLLSLCFSGCSNGFPKKSVEQESFSGVTSIVALEQDSVFGKYMISESQLYIVDSLAVSSDKLSKTEIKVVLGTWCHDSHIQVPRFLKLLQVAGYNQEIEFIALDKNKQAKGIDLSELSIERIPTFIIYHDGTELGRIVERPVVSLEKDLANILLEMN